jgi:hypothetical protein
LNGKENDTTDSSEILETESCKKMPKHQAVANMGDVLPLRAPF